MQQQMQPNLFDVKHLILGHNKKIKKGKHLVLVLITRHSFTLSFFTVTISSNNLLFHFSV